MNKRLYRLHEAYGKHNPLPIDAPFMYGALIEHLAACPCGGYFSVEEDPKMGGSKYRFNHGTTITYYASVYKQLPTQMKADFLEFVSKIVGPIKYTEILKLISQGG